MSFMITLMVDASEAKALKSVLAEAKNEADEERAARQKHESRLDEVQQELKDAIKKYEPCSARCRIETPNLLRRSKVRRRTGLKPKAPVGRSERPSRSRWVRPLICKTNL